MKRLKKLLKRLRRHLYQPNPCAYRFFKTVFLEVDTLDFAIDLVLSQYGENGRLHPIAYRSRKFSTIEINYEIHDKELLAIIDTFEEWHHLLKEVQHTTTVYTDHKNLEYFMSAQVLNQRQAR
jgi:hypothetical protein